MDTNPQDPIKIVFSQFNRALLSVLTTSEEHERQGLRAVIESEIANLSRSVGHVLQTNLNRFVREETVQRNDLGEQDSLCPDDSHDRGLDLGEGESWTQRNIIPADDQLHVPTPTTYPWPLRDFHQRFLRSSSDTNEPTSRTPLSQSNSAMRAIADTSLNGPASYLLSLELNAGVGNISTSSTIQTQPIHQFPESSTLSFRQRFHADPYSQSHQSYDMALDIFSHPSSMYLDDFGQLHAQSAFSNNIPYVPGDYSEPMQTDKDGCQTSGLVIISTPSQQAKEIHKPHRGKQAPNTNALESVYDHVNTRRTLRKFVTTDKDHILDLLIRLTNAIGNAESLIQLRTSIVFARQKRCIASSQQVGSHDLAHTMRALDMLDTVSHHSSILRRYYLVRLLRHRLKSEAILLKEKDKIKHVDANAHKIVKSSRSQSDIRNKEGSHTKRSIQERPTRVVRADSQALQDMMKLLYPHLNTASKDTDKAGDNSQYERLLSKLKNRLACARNWHHFAEQYSIGVLAIIPSGSRSGISSDHIEKLPAGIVSNYLEFLKQVKGPFLQSVCFNLSENIFPILCGSKDIPAYQLENFDDDTILEAEGDPKMLQNLCSISTDVSDDCDWD